MKRLAPLLLLALLPTPPAGAASPDSTETLLYLSGYASILTGQLYSYGLAADPDNAPLRDCLRQHFSVKALAHALAPSVAPQLQGLDTDYLRQYFGSSQGKTLAMAIIHSSQLSDVPPLVDTGTRDSPEHQRLVGGFYQQLNHALQQAPVQTALADYGVSVLMDSCNDQIADAIVQSVVSAARQPATAAPAPAEAPPPAPPDDTPPHFDLSGRVPNLDIP